VAPEFKIKNILEVLRNCYEDSLKKRLLGPHLGESSLEEQLNHYVGVPKEKKYSCCETSYSLMCNEEIPPSPFSSLPEDPDEFLKENEKTSPSEFPMWVQIRENKSDSFLVPEIKIEDVFMSEFNEGRIEMDTESWLQSILQI
jgi:hypothetical protein